MTESEDRVRHILGPVLRNGWPDFALPGVPLVGIEAKTEGQDLTDEQLQMANLLVAAGARYLVITERKDGSLQIWDYGNQRNLTVEELRHVIARTG